MQLFRSIIKTPIRSYNSFRFTSGNTTRFIRKPKPAMRDLENDSCPVERKPTEHVMPENEVPDRMYPHHMFTRSHIGNSYISNFNKNQGNKSNNGTNSNKTASNKFVVQEHVFTKDGVNFQKVMRSCIIRRHILCIFFQSIH